MIISLGILFVLIVTVTVLLQHPAFGRKPNEESYARMQRSSAFRDGVFHNRVEKPVMTKGKKSVLSMFKFIFSKPKNLRPDSPIPVNNPDLNHLDRSEDVAVWFGHSSIFLQTDGIRYLVDPVLTCEFPVSLMMKPFKGCDKITPNSIPKIDFLIITHDHWDHLDYGTVSKLRTRVGKVVCPLGVGEYFRLWDYADSNIIELDWDESVSLGDGKEIVCLPSQHFSGRLLKRNQTLWASYLLRTENKQIYFSGDGGYDSRFKEINRKYGSPDFAFLENGQYNEDWHTVHLMPEELVKAVQELNPKRFMTIHNSKFALSRHHCKEPLEKIYASAVALHLNLITPKIGERVYLKDSTQKFGEWWK